MLSPKASKLYNWQKIFKLWSSLIDKLIILMCFEHTQMVHSNYAWHSCGGGGLIKSHVIWFKTLYLIILTFQMQICRKKQFKKRKCSKPEGEVGQKSAKNVMYYLNDPKTACLSLGLGGIKCWLQLFNLTVPAWWFN